MQLVSPNIRIVRKVFSDGERCPLLVNAIGVPLYDPTIWAMTAIRPRSTETMAQSLNGAMFLHLFCWRWDIDLPEAIATGRFFDVGQLENLTTDAFKGMSELRSKAIVQTDRRKPAIAKTNSVGMLRRAKARPKSLKVLDSETARLRLYYARNYLTWLGERQKARFGIIGIHDPSFAALEHYSTRLREFIASIASRSPDKKDNSRVCLDSGQLARLLAVTEPNSPENPWKSQFVKLRNWFIITWLRGLGVRKGEFLGVNVRDFNRGQSIVDIKRRHDNKKEPRTKEPKAKTLERQLPLNTLLVELGERYLEARAKIPAARKHGSLLVSQSGAPLSESSITEIFAQIRRKFPEIGDICAHILRHQWNDDYSKYSDEIGLDADEEKRERIWLMGWVITSEMPGKYLKRRTQEKAHEHLKGMQEKIMGLRNQ